MGSFGASGSAWLQFMERNHESLNMFKGSLAYEVGDGRHIKFWEDVWCGVRALKAEFPTSLP